MAATPQNVTALRKTGVGLAVAAYLALIYMSLTGPLYARTHPHMDQIMLTEYTSAWPVALGCAVGIGGVMLSLIPLRRGEKWSFWTSLAMLAVLLVSRISTDPRCLQVLNPHQHGCHTFMITAVVGAVGLLLAAR
jgi:hypothetical protein